MKHRFFYRRIVAPIVVLLTQGIAPEKIALSLAFGIVLGIFPARGGTAIPPRFLRFPMLDWSY